MCAKANGGWKRVFPKSMKFPIWASRIRNYFNVSPDKLKLLDEGLAKALVKRANNYDFFDSPVASMALSGDVYVDGRQRIWYEMRAGSTIHHYKAKISPKDLRGYGDKVLAAGATLRGQARVPVFKLISPDRTGGSREICLHNWQLHNSLWDAFHPVSLIDRRATSGKSRIGKVGQWVNIRNKIVNDKVYQGSYNYSETIRVGLPAHEYRDVKPHSTAANFYVDPPMSTDLESRRFPETDQQGRILANMN